MKLSITVMILCAFSSAFNLYLYAKHGDGFSLLVGALCAVALAIYAASLLIKRRNNASVK